MRRDDPQIHRSVRRAVAIVAKAAVGVASTVTALVLTVGPASAAAVMTSTPSTNAVVTKAPSSIVLASGAAFDIGRSVVAVRSSDDKVIASSRTERPSVKGTTVSLPVPTLKAGVYTTSWTLRSADGAISSQGSSAFTVDPTGSSPALVTTGALTYNLIHPSDAVERWAAFVFLMTFLGAIFLRFLVSAPIARRFARSGGSSGLLEQTDRRLFLVAGVSFLAFIPATLSQLVEESKASTVSFWQSIKPNAIADFLGADAGGNLWLARLILTALAAVVVLPVFVMVARRRGRWASWWPVAMGAGAIFAALNLLCATLPSKAPASWFQEVVTFTLDWGHLLGASVWIGGLIALVAFVGTVRGAAQRPGAFWSEAVRRFSTVATVSAGVMVLTGLWTFWIHVGFPDRLLTTLYGKTLLVKLVLVAVLLGIGAFNQLWLVPRASELGKSAAVQRGRVLLLVSHFRQVVALEAFLGIAILFIVPFLSNSARNQDFQRQLSNVTQVGHAGADEISFTPSGLAVGPTNYTIAVPDSTTGLVNVAFSSPRLGIPPTVVPATEIAPGSYQVSGLYTGIAGEWQAQVSLPGANGDTETTSPFRLAVAAVAPTPTKAPSVTIHAGTWGWAILDTLVVGGSLFGARRFSARRRRRPADEPEELFELATVGK